jgi:hypothetical protein
MVFGDYDLIQLEVLFPPLMNAPLRKFKKILYYF